MKNDNSYREFQEKIFQQIDEMENMERGRIVKDLVTWAETKGLEVEDLLRMLDSGMSPSDLVRAIQNK